MAIYRANPLYEQIYQFLWDSIIKGEVRPGDRMRDTDWAERLEVSRTPVREALRKLEHDGVLEGLEAGGYQLRVVTTADLRDLYSCRAVLEGLAARTAVAGLGPDALDRLAQELEGSRAAISVGRFEEVRDTNTAFHDTIIQAAGNRHLVRLIRSLRRLIMLHRTTLLSVARTDGRLAAAYAAHLEATADDHAEVLAALRCGDPDQVERAMRSHVENTAAGMEALHRAVAPA